MSEVKKSLSAAGAVVAGALAVIAGTSWRNSVDLGAAQTNTRPTLAGLVASSEAKQDVPEAAYFQQLSQLLKDEYVDPIDDDLKLADGAVRGMVMSLNDPKAIYLAADELPVYERALAGKFEGVGAFFVLQSPKLPPTAAQELSERLPTLMVGEVVPGGPADKAGVKVGDVVYAVDGRWILNADEIAKFRALQDAVDKKQASPDALLKARRDLRAKSETSILPNKAYDKLFLGKSGTVKVTWQRGANRFDTTLSRGESNLGSGFRFGADAAASLKKLAAAGSPVKLDLRNNAGGNYDAMLRCLAVVLPKGTVGYLKTERGKAEAIELKSGAATSQKFELTVDGTTRGAAAIFAKVLKAKGAATLTGVPSNDTVAVQLVKLADGTGYTLPIGTVTTEATK